MTKTNVTLVPLQPDDREQFILDNQRAFKCGFHAVKFWNKYCPEPHPCDEPENCYDEDDEFDGMFYFEKRTRVL